MTQMERAALDQSGTLRSFYDGYRDTIQGKLSGDFTTNSIKCQEPPTCLLIEGRTAESQTLLQMIQIDPELRLNIYLKMIPTYGITSLIDYPQLIDANTRFLYFHYKAYIESCDDDFEEAQRKSLSKSSATHIITKISYGINVIIVLQLPSQEAKEIDAILIKIHQSLINDKSGMEMNSAEKDLCDRITSTTVYSNINDLTKLNKLEDVYKTIFKLKKNKNEHQRLNYTLSPLYSQFIEIESSTIETLEIYLLQQLNEFKTLRFRLDHRLPKLLNGQLKPELKDAHQQLAKINEFHEKQLQHICELVVKIRKGIDVDKSSDQLMELYTQTENKDSIRKLIDFLDRLQSKGDFISSLKDNGFDYCNVNELGIKQGYNEQLIEEILRGNYIERAVFCSTDKLRSNNKDNWNNKYNELIEEHKMNPQLCLVYADFTYTTYTLKRMSVITPKESPIKNNHSNSQSSEKKLSTNEYINILLLGESGVGKSTFINAFANCLRFQSLEEAQQGEPIVIIPTSFMMTTNDNFEERIIKFGEADPNENHNDFGQSVTQQCKSYVFNISNDKKLRIIDTPGFGDTRGDQQDDLNMEEIFSFLNHFTYLNGICLLFKPEIGQLNPYFRSCCTQLFDYFGENIRDHFIFCFTNARSTFFAPGNARPLLNAFFDTFPVKKIPFTKANTFSFDSKSFRYLIAIRNSIKFHGNERDEFKQSWSRSVAESKRFRNFLIEQHQYCKNDKWQSIKQAQIQINDMIRPLLEAMRNLLRNMILYNTNASIQLHPTPNVSPSMICYSCDRQTDGKPVQFWILPDQSHPYPSLNTISVGSSNKQKPMEYKLSYELVNNQVDETLADLRKQLKYLYETCAELSYFLMNNSPSIQEDPFLNGLDRMVNEEQFICDRQTSTDLNKILIEKLKHLRTKYAEHLNTMKSDNEDLTLSNIYHLIKSADKIPMVKIQLDAIRDYHELLVENNQRVVRLNKPYQ